MFATGNQRVGSISDGWASIHLREYKSPKDFMELVCQLLVKVKLYLSRPLMHTGEV